MPKYDENGFAIPDSTPLDVPVDIRQAESMDERIRRIIREASHIHPVLTGEETFEESQDFNIEDDLEAPPSVHEERFINMASDTAFSEPVEPISDPVAPSNMAGEGDSPEPEVEPTD